MRQIQQVQNLTHQTAGVGCANGFLFAHLVAILFVMFFGLQPLQARQTNELRNKQL